MSAPQRFKDLEDLSPADHAERHAAQRRGEQWTPPETDAYKERRREVLERAGLTDDEETP